MGDIEKSFKNALLTANGIVSFHNNEPIQYNGKQRQYFSPETRTFTQKYAKYSSDFVEAQIQGIDPNNPFDFQTRYIRMADIVKPTAAIQRGFDDYKMIIVADRDIEYITPGSKIVACGSTWIVFNPLNISGSDGATVIRRCNAVWTFYDYYGNIVQEPIVVENVRANANDSDTQNSQYVSKGYFNVMCQYNANTRQIDTNTRLILGSGAYRVTGFSDFEQEFTGDYASVRMLNFTVRYEEPNDAIDDMDNHIAGGKTFNWDMVISGQTSLNVGSAAQMTVQSIRNGESVNSTAENPIYYEWSSSDNSVATVDGLGKVTAVGDGTATITAKLYQNNNYSASLQVAVDLSENAVKFTSTVPETIGAFECVEISAAYFVDGAEQSTALTWSLTGADETAYSYTVSADGKTLSVNCFGYSAVPLTITATCETYSVTGTMQLQGI